MSFVKKSLGPGEKIEYETTYHWIVFFSWSSIFTLLIAPLISIWTSEFAITNQRVIMKEGLFARHSMEMNLNRIESTLVEQSIMGRIFGYGTIQLIGTGGNTETFQWIPRPLAFRRKILELNR